MSKGRFPKGNEHPNRKKYLDRLSLGVATCFVCEETKELEEFSKEKGKYINRCRSCSSTETRKRQLKHVAAFQEFKSSFSCIRCGEDDIYCLDFHHKDPTAKRFEISTRGARPLTPEVLDEIAKCVVLCKNCHTKLHADRFTLEDILNGA